MVVGVITVIIALINFQITGAFKEAAVTEDKPIFLEKSRFPKLGAVAGWISSLAFIGTLVWSAIRLAQTLKPKSFAILYPVSGPEVILMVLVGLVALTAIVSYIGYRLNVRSGSKTTYRDYLVTYLTHGFFGLVILGTIYPILYVLSASFDPLNRLTQASLGTSQDPLLIRARVLPSLEGLSLANYAKLVEGVLIQPWQWILLAVIALGALVWVFKQWLISWSGSSTNGSSQGILAMALKTFLELPLG